MDYIAILFDPRSGRPGRRALPLFWGHFCDWYLEVVKDRLDDPVTLKITLMILENSLKMIHPFMPFVTEEIWSKLKKDQKPLCVQTWPDMKKRLIDRNAEREMQILIDLVASIRNTRTQWNVKPHELIPCHFSTQTQETISLLRENSSLLTLLARLDRVIIDQTLAKSKNEVTAIVGDVKYAVALGEIIDVEKEKERIAGEVKNQQKAFETLSQRLKNKEFLSKAPEEVVEKERQRLVSLETKVVELKKAIANLEQGINA